MNVLEFKKGSMARVKFQIEERNENGIFDGAFWIFTFGPLGLYLFLNLILRRF